MSGTRDKNMHSLDAAGAGDLGAVESGDVLGPCPSCGTELREAHIKHPHTGRVERAIEHPEPFCTYFGETHPDTIERAIQRAPKEK